MDLIISDKFKPDSELFGPTDKFVYTGDVEPPKNTCHRDYIERLANRLWIHIDRLQKQNPKAKYKASVRICADYDGICDCMVDGGMDYIQIEPFLYPLEKCESISEEIKMKLDSCLDYAWGYHIWIRKAEYSIYEV
jgi:hypothetical protein